MAIVTANALTANGNGSQATSYTTASISPGVGRLVLLTTHTENVSGGNVTPTVSGCSLTWVQIATVDGTQGRLTMFRALGTPTAGTVTIACGGQSQYNCIWTVDEFIHVDPSGANGANAIIQAGTTWQDNTPNNSGVTVTLGAFSNLNNATYGSCINKNSANLVAGGNFTQLGNANNNGLIMSEWANTNQTSVNWTWTSSGVRSWAIAVELKAFMASGFFPFL